MRVVGTAGHVDHGKSTLVQALTGINPDRLREEQERQMTIDLGFAWLDLPGGQTVGIVDVPGHIDFIENMLAGVGGIDAAILAIAADEGVMPQTREHADILELLGIDRAVVALTKVDLVEDQEWLDLVEADVRKLLEPLSMANSPIVRVSARTGEGLDTFRRVLARVVDDSPAPVDVGRPRLSIDRCFTVAGFGTVVTGTLLDGAFSVGDDVVILPSGIESRIRGLQTHRAALQEAQPGSRVAVNLAGVEVEAVERGDAVVHPGTVASSDLLDVFIRQPASAPGSIKHNAEVKFFLGAAQRMGTVRVLGGERRVRPGEEGWLQVQLSEPIVAAKGDRYILRRPSPPATLGGGQVVDAHPGRRHRLKDLSVVHDLEKALRGDPEDQLEAVVARLGVPTLKDAIVASGLGLADGRAAAEALISKDRIRFVGAGKTTDARLVVTANTWQAWRRHLLGILEIYHRENPMRGGMPQEEARTRMKLGQEPFADLLRGLADAGDIEHQPPEVRLPGFKVEMTPEQEKRAEDLLARFRSSEASPSMKESVVMAGESVVRHLISRGDLVAVSGEVLMGREMYERWLSETLAILESGETLTVAQLRDRFGSSRKYVLAFLEHLDSEGVTMRQGDIRRINPTRRT